ncbi:MAG TPA: helix-turn-helix transcriptional regulator [Candidatus Acidoferrum sp.]|jgi:NarL family two-component system response regulator YdfI|nr:helix-turn-helix transcriptional regulator [Candidatus Acidoferrum sp.]
MRITDTDKTVLLCLARGMQSKEIAARLGRSKPTVESYIRTLFIKLDARSRAQLVAVAIRTGVIDVTAA